MTIVNDALSAWQEAQQRALDLLVKGQVADRAFLAWDGINRSERYTLLNAASKATEQAVVAQRAMEDAWHHYQRVMSLASAAELEAHQHHLPGAPMPDRALLISVTEAAALLGVTRQSVSGRLARESLASWPDPDDSRYRLVLKSEVEALAASKTRA